MTAHPAPPPEDRLLSPREAAALLGLTVEALSSRRKRGQIPYVPLPGGHVCHYKLSTILKIIDNEVPATVPFGARRKRRSA